MVVSAGGCMAAGAHAPSAGCTTREKEKGGSGATEIVMKKGNIVFPYWQYGPGLKGCARSDTVQALENPKYINHAGERRESTCRDLL